MHSHTTTDMFIEDLEPFIQDLKKPLGFLAKPGLLGLFQRQSKATWIKPKDFPQVDRLIRKHYGDSPLFSEKGTPEQFVSQVCRAFEVITRLQASKELSPDPNCKYLQLFFIILANYYHFEYIDKLRIQGKKVAMYQAKNGMIITFPSEPNADLTKDYKKLPYKNDWELITIEIKERILFYYEQMRYIPYTVLIMSELEDILPPKLIDWLSEDQSSYGTIY